MFGLNFVKFFYFIGNCFFTAGKGNAGSDECLPSISLWAWLQRIPAKHLLLVLDTGDASAFLHSMSARVVRRPDDFADMDIAIIAPQGDADESEDLHHGAVANAVLESLRNTDSDIDGDGYLSAAELQAAFAVHLIKEQRIKGSGTGDGQKFAKLRVLPGLLSIGHDFPIKAYGARELTDASRGTKSYVESNPAPVQVLSSHYYALVIGANEYQTWPKLKNPVNDAESVGKELETRFGFHVTRLMNPTRDDIVKALTKLRAQPFAPDDELFMFFAGHGTYDEQLKMGYLAAVDSKLEKDDQLHDSFYDESTLFRLLESITAKHVFVVIDACQSGAQFMHRDDPKKDIGYEPSKKLEALLRKKDRKTYFYMTSGGDEYVPDGVGIHSPFANQLLRALSINDPEGIVTLRDVIEMADQVQKGAPQPLYGWLPNADPASDFWLVANPHLRVETATQK